MTSGWLIKLIIGIGVGVEASWPAMAAVEKGTNAARSRPVRVRLMPRSYPIL